MIIKNENSLDYLAKLRHRLLGAGGLATMDAVHRFQMFTDFDKRLSDNPYGRSPDHPGARLDIREKLSAPCETPAATSTIRLISDRRTRSSPGDLPATR